MDCLLRKIERANVLCLISTSNITGKGIFWSDWFFLISNDSFTSVKMAFTSYFANTSGGTFKTILSLRMSHALACK